MKTTPAAAPRPGRRPVDHEGLLTAKASRVLKVLSPEARKRFLDYVMALDQELRHNECKVPNRALATNADRRKAG
jgi:hypothetical protein